MRIGVALSGGGIRATTFHLGVLHRLAQQSLIENINFLSTVSGGTLAVALVRTCSDNAWPSSDAFIKQTIPNARSLLINHSLRCAYLRCIFLSPWTLRQGRANALAGALKSCWSVEGDLSNLPNNPSWIINATCYETGRNWRFGKERMGDFIAGYVSEPQLSIAQAIAASVAFPGLVGSLKIDTGKFEWFEYDKTRTPRSHIPAFQIFSLWDGGVYDNLGVEALFKPSKGYNNRFDFFVVSDASASLRTESRKIKAPLHLLEIATNQVRSLRARTIVSYFQSNPSSGAYLKIGKTEEHIYNKANRSDMAKRINHDSLNEVGVSEAENIDTTLRKLTEREFDLLFTHGYQVADATFSAYCSDLFQPSRLTSANRIRSTIS